MRAARHYAELVVWQLADEIRVETLKLTRRPAFVDDRKLHAQTEDAVNSVCRNIAEGFACESHVEFARFLEISTRSLNELGDAFRGATQKGYVTPADLMQVRSLSRRLFPALGRFKAYLRRTPHGGRRAESRTSRTDQSRRRP